MKIHQYFCLKNKPQIIKDIHHWHIKGNSE